MRMPGLTTPPESPRRTSCTDMLTLPIPGSSSTPITVSAPKSDLVPGNDVPSFPLVPPTDYKMITTPSSHAYDRCCFAFGLGACKPQRRGNSDAHHQPAITKTCTPASTFILMDDNIGRALRCNDTDQHTLRNRTTNNTASRTTTQRETSAS
ncbi:hypothetical protein OG21DRAFT_1190226 [Imleria badia]|nr:hypothetical protein OG21DRAFT_1190226 [Imleria badia]